MKILLPKEIGFCKGVSAAIEKATNAGKCYCLGQIVHNATVQGKLSKLGIETIDSLDQAPDNSTVVIRAHGVGPQVYADAKKRNIKLIDATCPYVRAIQVKAKKYYQDGYQIVLVGDKSHPEIVGINQWCNNTAIVFDGNGTLQLNNAEKVLVMFQTTFDNQQFEKTLQNICSDGVKTLEIFNTICYTTLVRQYYAKKLSSCCDLAVVVGDKNSSNTKRLFDIASQNCKTIWTDGSQDIDLTNCRSACVVSGASTPPELIKGVLEIMTKNAKEAVSIENVAEEKAMGKDEAMLAKAVSEMKEGHRYKLGQKVKCRVVLVADDGVYVSIPSSKKEGFIPNEELDINGNFAEFKSQLKNGSVIECSVVSVDKGITLSKKVIDERSKDDELVVDIKEGKQFELTMTRVGKECLTGKLGSYTVIVHASQIKLGYVKNLEQYVGKKLRLVVSGPDKVDEAKHIIFASQKAILLEEKKAKEDEFWNNIEVDEIVEGKVLRFASFGAFVDVRGFDCLAHTSDLSWEHVAGPQDVLELDKTYEFVVLSLDREKNRVSLGYKQLQPQPWQLAEEKFTVGSVVKGKVARIMPFGAFIELDKHIDGLLHVSNVSWEWLDDINKALKVGDEVEVQILEFDAEHKRITLSRKAILPRPEQAPAEEEKAETEKEAE